MTIRKFLLRTGLPRRLVGFKAKNVLQAEKLASTCPNKNNRKNNCVKQKNQKPENVKKLVSIQTVLKATENHRKMLRAKIFENT